MKLRGSLFVDTILYINDRNVLLSRWTWVQLLLKLIEGNGLDKTAV